MIHVTGDKVAIQPRFDPDTTPGGLYIPDIAKERCDQGVVKYIGPKVKDIRIGDLVLFGGWDGTNIHINNEGYLIILREPYIKAVFGNIVTEIPGLFFKTKFDEEALDNDIKEVLNDILGEFGVGSDRVVKEYKHKIVGLMAKHYPYFPATYEMAIQIITDHFSTLPKFGNTSPNIHDREIIPNED